MSYDRSQPITDRSQVNLSELARLAERAAGPVPYSTESGFYQSAIGNVMDVASSGSTTFSGFLTNLSAVSQNCPVNATTTISLAGSALVDTDGYLPSGSNSAVTLPFDGHYLFGATYAGTYASNLAAIQRTYFYVDSAGTLPGVQMLYLPTGVASTDVIYANVSQLLNNHAEGDSVAFAVSNGPGQDFLLLNATYFCIFWGVFLGPL